MNWLRSLWAPGRWAPRKAFAGLCPGLLFLAPTIVGAQITLGAQVGLSTFTVKGDAPPRTAYARSWGGAGGLIVEWEISDGVALGFQPSWIQKGTGVRVEVKGIDEPVDTMDLRLDYLSFPLLLKVSTRRHGGFVTAGVDVGYLHSAVLNVRESERDVKDILESTDLSALFGVGGTLRRFRPTVTLELRYHQSLLRVLPAAPPEGEARALPGGFRSNGFELTMGVLLPPGGGAP